ncbi:hypothetical protein N7457_003119 [Penicillium paradoxum]|uniref:uncharacterized protein n=1 Tax=Penicillium paradoxum TaxID=176176 RepID=UPI0025469B92|nr:uncharacterized protein N7457_003119 [Penicillium paradoxum]KAJ5788129.1 hypothetical protein N7457_003119 [Penicillium paradoxum]
MEEERLALDNNYSRLGGGSIMAMKLVSVIRLSGYHSSVTDIFRNMQLRDLQRQDVEATVSAPRSAVQYNMLYMNKEIDVDSLVTCFNKLVARHHILRTIFVRDSGHMLQIVLERLFLSDFERFTDEPVSQCCKYLAKDDIKIDPYFEFGKTSLGLFVVHGAKENGFMIHISHAQYDGISFPGIPRQLEMQY